MNDTGTGPCSHCWDVMAVTAFDGIPLPCPHCNPDAAAACLSDVYRAWAKVRAALNDRRPRWINHAIAIGDVGDAAAASILALADEVDGRLHA